jgi:hypothetical protein
VARNGYAVSPSTQTAQAVFVNPVIEVEFLAVEANGTPNTVSTTELTLKFSEAIQDLSLDNITVDGGGFTVGGLVPAGGGVYRLPLSNVAAQSMVTVSVIKAGYAIGSSLISPVTVSYPLHLSVTANGTPGQQTTDLLTLAFDRAIDGLDADNITVSGLTNGNLIKTETPGTYSLGVSGVTKTNAQAAVMVTLNKSGYPNVPTQVQVVYYKAFGMPVAGQESNPSIKEKFGVVAKSDAKPDKIAAVTDTFYELSAFIKNGGLSQNVVKTGDWIDLEGGLIVAKDTAGQGDFTHAGDATAKDNTPLLRLIVVGINSFNNINSNGATQHVVFQFQNIPVDRTMHSSNAEIGYKDSELQKYLTGNFLTGLTGTSGTSGTSGAGVPGDVLWAPARVLSNGVGENSGTTVSDKLWLPTVWEMTGVQGSSSKAEKEGNQARLEYYTGNFSESKTIQKKSVASASISGYYWLSSRVTKEEKNFAMVSSSSGTLSYNPVSSGAKGVAPAFCVGPGN